MKMLSDYPDRICLTGMSFYGYTGCFDFEKQNGQTFLVDLTLCFSGLQAARTDILSDTVHYGEVFDVVKDVVENGRFNLIEFMAGRIASGVLDKFPKVEAVEVAVSKPDAPVAGTFKAMGVRIFRDRTTVSRSDTGEI